MKPGRESDHAAWLEWQIVLRQLQEVLKRQNGREFVAQPVVELPQSSSRVLCVCGGPVQVQQATRSTRAHSGQTRLDAGELMRFGRAGAAGRPRPRPRSRTLTRRRR